MGAFLPWHRLFVRAHEILLQQECGYTGAQPYWDEVSDVEQINNGTLAFEELAVFDPDTGFGGNGLDGNGCITDGPFADLTLHINASGLPDVNGGYCVTRNFNLTWMEKADRPNLENCFQNVTFEDARQCIEADPHSAGHGGVGALVCDPLLTAHTPHPRRC